MDVNDLIGAIHNLKASAELSESRLMAMRNFEAKAETAEGLCSVAEERAERAEALLADERLRVANLKAELAARPAVTEETVQEIAREHWPEEIDYGGYKRGDGSAHQELVKILRRHLLPATTEPVPSDDVPRCPDCGYSQDDAKLHGDHKLCGGTIPSTPEPLPNGVWWWNDIAEAFFNRIGNDTIGYYEGSAFHKNWYPRRHEFPKSQEEAERRQKPDELMAEIDSLARTGDRPTYAARIRKLVLREREAGL